MSTMENNVILKQLSVNVGRLLWNREIIA